MAINTVNMNTMNYSFVQNDLLKGNKRKLQRKFRKKFK